ncbi:MAG: hypothetical protein L0K02_06515, partial [Corynebacterium sp.]|nr:hypothetical protein [Corynebacterium sp.]
MMDKHIHDAADVDATRRADEFLDVIAAGGTPQTDDELLLLLAAARSQADKNIPDAPVVAGADGAAAGPAAAPH